FAKGILGRTEAFPLEYRAVFEVELHTKKSPPLGDELPRYKNTPGWVFFVEISLMVIKSPV
ncbi:MAG: hypothetical protein AAB569_00915, partial [Patescibacteria group bacterium]